MLENIEIAQEEHHVPHGLLPGTNDIRVRDFMPIQKWQFHPTLPDCSGSSARVHFDRRRTCPYLLRANLLCLS